MYAVDFDASHFNLICTLIRARNELLFEVKLQLQQITRARQSTEASLKVAWRSTFFLECY